MLLYLPLLLQQQVTARRTLRISIYTDHATNNTQFPMKSTNSPSSAVTISPWLLLKKIIFTSVLYFSAATPCLAAAPTHPEHSKASDTSLSTFIPPPLRVRKEQRIRYKEALVALQNNEQNRYNKITHELSDYPLHPYLQYYKLKKNIHKTTIDEIDNFITQHPEIPVNHFLKSKKLFSLSRNKKWLEYSSFYSESKNTSLKCHYQYAKSKTQRDAHFFREIKQLWLVGHSQPESCDPLFKLLKKSKYFSSELVWQRFILSLKDDNISLARYLAKDLPPSLKTLANKGIALYRWPARLQEIDQFPATDNKTQELVESALSRLIYKDPDMAMILWPQYQSKFRFSTDVIHQLQDELAIILAVRFHPEAAFWLERANLNRHNKLVHELKIRTALRQLNWNEVHHQITLMPQAQRKLARWQYWYARSLKKITSKKDKQADSILQQLADNRGFYGFLARGDRKPYTGGQTPAQHISPDELAAVNSMPGIQRAREFYLLEQHINARREWYHTIIQLNARQRLIAAGIATDWGWTSQSIQAISTTDNLHYLSLRYPRGYQKEISSHAHSNNIDQEFVFALVRQESLFRPDAYSPAGAIGMMQLLPATAKEVAKSFNIPYEGKHELLQADKNIQLGTSYLKQLLSTFDNNKIFATAAYNAGPHRVVKWIPETPLPADVWIETIPFKETRNYVKHILSSEEIYRRNNWKNNSLLLAKTSRHAD